MEIEIMLAFFRQMCYYYNITVTKEGFAKRILCDERVGFHPTLIFLKG